MKTSGGGGGRGGAGRGSLPLTEAQDTSQVVNKRRINDIGTYWTLKESGDYETQSFGGAANLLAN